MLGYWTFVADLTQARQSLHDVPTRDSNVTKEYKTSSLVRADKVPSGKLEDFVDDDDRE